MNLFTRTSQATVNVATINTTDEDARKRDFLDTSLNQPLLHYSSILALRTQKFANVTDGYPSADFKNQSLDRKCDPNDFGGDM